ncbi:lysine-rich nucleolar protein 1 [Solea solea]|uniref:lysine-rich nucleolar protein 1 n=1 Tax=Solea solea TaxID=90069 RepID=UPI00272BEACB|nr:lysine-rich nucleolar protein 1 [Solea solea]XP_058497361.1 lysine-rich nucleolar protein 1 [Solea solea]XP_058497362.1 lysine-rich nucleolar protein 1 [Solea solea]XP_058497363.1 lysine-rich nucleolar protein 1 [Solea solea]
MEEEKHAKKKLKKGQTSVPENPDCSVDVGRQTEVKKAKKNKRSATFVIEVEDQSCETERKKKKSKESVNESPNDACSSDATGVKNKKKPVEISQSSVKEDIENQQIRVKKGKKKNKVQTKADIVTINKEEEEEQQPEENKVPKKAKKVKKLILAVSTEETVEQSKEKKKKKKKLSVEETAIAVVKPSITKKKPKMGENAFELEIVAGEREETETKIKKKAKTEDDENGIETPDNKGNNKKCKAKKKEKENVMGESETITEDGKTGLKKKGKKGKDRKVTMEVSEEEELEPKKKKRKNERSQEKEQTFITCEENEEDGQNGVTVANDTSKKIKKKKLKQAENDVGVETSANKKIKRESNKEEESQHGEVVFLSAKSGNVDEVTINKERRRELQMEIDKASQPEKPAKPLGLGQWSTAEFDSSEQQHKFLRLLGGFKKGLQPAAAGTGGASMAMGKDAQQKLKQGLLGQFESAQSRRMDFNSRGAGLGFSAPSNKKFSIDINASRSVHFDD